MIDRVFAPSTLLMADKLRGAAASGQSVNMEAKFSQMTLDVIGKAVFNYDFDALTTDSPLIQAVYTALKETEQRATDLLPYWKVSGACFFGFHFLGFIFFRIAELDRSIAAYCSSSF